MKTHSCGTFCILVPFGSIWVFGVYLFGASDNLQQNAWCSFGKSSMVKNGRFIMKFGDFAKKNDGIGIHNNTYIHIYIYIMMYNRDLMGYHEK